MKISIIMAYYNRRNLLYNTLMQFQNLYQDYDYEVIIVDDASDEEHRIKDFEEQFPNTRVREVTKKEKGTRLNPGVAYNKGFSEAVGEIIIIQNPECYHVGNILGHAIENLQEQDYFSYSCFSPNNNELTAELLNSNNVYALLNDKDFKDRNNFNPTECLSWYNHPIDTGRQTAYHFCSAIYKSKLDLINGFDERFSDGYCFDDDAFVLSIKHNLKLKITIPDPGDGFVIHQYHQRSPSFNCLQKSDDNPIKKRWLKNKSLFDQIKLNHEIHNFKYPKLLHLYWDGSPLSFLHYLTILSFDEHNKDWKIVVHTPTKRTKTLSWKTHEQKLKYTGACYFHKLYDIPNVVVRRVDLNKLGFYNEASEVIKSDYIRFYMLQKHGGLWSDFDILYTGSIEENMNFPQDTILFEGVSYQFPHAKGKGGSYRYYPIGLLLATPNNKFFKFIVEQCRDYYDKEEYQCIGAVMFDKLFPTSNEIFNVSDSVKVCNADYYLPWAWNEIDQILNKGENILPDNTVGVHWFNGGDASKEYINNLEERLKDFKVGCFLDKLIEEYIE